MEIRPDSHLAEPSDSAYANRWFFLRKPNGKIRWIQNLQKVNVVTIRDVGSVPHADLLAEGAAEHCDDRRRGWLDQEPFACICRRSLECSQPFPDPSNLIICRFESCVVVESPVTCMRRGDGDRGSRRAERDGRCRDRGDRRSWRSRKIWAARMSERIGVGSGEGKGRRGQGGDVGIDGVGVRGGRGTDKVGNDEIGVRRSRGRIDGVGVRGSRGGSGSRVRGGKPVGSGSKAGKVVSVPGSGSGTGEGTVGKREEGDVGIDEIGERTRSGPMDSGISKGGEGQRGSEGVEDGGVGIGGGGGSFGGRVRGRGRISRDAGEGGRERRGMSGRDRGRDQRWGVRDKTGKSEAGEGEGRNRGIGGAEVGDEGGFSRNTKGEGMSGRGRGRGLRRGARDGSVVEEGGEGDPRSSSHQPRAGSSSLELLLSLPSGLLYSSDVSATYWHTWQSRCTKDVELRSHLHAITPWVPAAFCRNQLGRCD
ncbi:hypothetical protein CBR_g36338 [Chara braunii]|uniref:Uncharacterized protein n=1 Tax=Chara braunii TaxID=69332 RepID=A0A388LKK2_CHABU|nr:hypothetical protein CBR_g36338 [Chara braunii]|eukprot:GBG82807.1 hypothetical protein CBR_g36338 [Chara braunii]